MSSAGEIAAPAAATQRASRTSAASAPASAPTPAITAATPATPPTKKYAGISQVQTGGFTLIGLSAYRSIEYRAIGSSNIGPSGIDISLSDDRLGVRGHAR